MRSLNSSTVSTRRRSFIAQLALSKSLFAELGVANLLEKTALIRNFAAFLSRTHTYPGAKKVVELGIFGSNMSAQSL